MLDALFGRLRDDAPLGALLEGGVYDQREVGVVSRQTTVDAFDDITLELLPCGLFAPSQSVVQSPYEGGTRTFFALFFYQRIGYDVTQQARERVYDLWQDWQPAADDERDGVWRVRWADETLGARDDVLKSALEVVRYEVQWQRRGNV